MINELDLNLFDSLRKIAQVIRIILWRISRETDLSPMQIQFIHYINGIKSKRSTVSELAKEFDLKKATVTGSINNLVNKGMISKVRSSSDKRKIHLRLTDKTDEILTIIDKYRKQFLTKISDDTQESRWKAQQYLTELLLRFHSDNTLQNLKICLNCNNYQEIDGFDELFFCQRKNRKLPKMEMRWNCDGYNEIIP